MGRLPRSALVSRNSCLISRARSKKRCFRAKAFAIIILLSTYSIADAGSTALAGPDQGELVTIPSLPDVADWQTYEAARQRLMPNLSLKVPAVRCRARKAA